MELNCVLWDNPKEPIRLQLKPLEDSDLMSYHVCRVVVVATLYIYFVWQVFFYQTQPALQIMLMHNLGENLGTLVFVFVAGAFALLAVILFIYLLARWTASHGLYLFVSFITVVFAWLAQIATTSFF